MKIEKLTFKLLFSHPKNETERKSIVLDNVTHIVFNGVDKKQEVVVANELLHSFMGTKRVKGKYYGYFFIKENTEYATLQDVIWVTKDQRNCIEDI